MGWVKIIAGQRKRYVEEGIKARHLSSGIPSFSSRRKKMKVLIAGGAGEIGWILSEVAS